MNIFDFIRELKRTPFNYEEWIFLLDDLIWKSLYVMDWIEDLEVEQVSILDRDEIEIWIQARITFYIKENKFQIRSNHMYNKPIARVDYYNESKGWEMTKMPMPDDIYDEDYNK